MATGNEDFLWMSLKEISTETEEKLGDRGYCFVSLHNDWSDLRGSLAGAYSQELPLTSLVAADFFSLAKDLHWMHRLLHWGNYQLVHRMLRYDWELMFRAYYADVYVPNIPGDVDVPGESVDDKVQWLEARGSDLNFRAFVPILNVILPEPERRHFKEIWRKLNQYVHPTKQLRYRLIEESALAVRDSFDKDWAEETVTHIAGAKLD